MSEQMKGPGNLVKNVEERNIPWSQQVDDEASYENLASPTTDNTGSHQNSMQFQYPPFNAKENQTNMWNNFKTRKSNSYESKKMGKPTFQNNSKREDFQSNAWGPHNTRRNHSLATENHNRQNRAEDNYVDSVKLDNRPGNNGSFDDKKGNSTTVVPKKTTWASIASQPAKLTNRTTSITSNQKKKGPGMPPPPMVPGKHDLDVNTWDLPNNNSPPVPSPPPTIDLAPNLSSDFSVVCVPTEDADIGRQVDRGQDFPKEENKANFNNINYGRTRHSPNGHPRKNWSTQHPLHPNRQINSVPGGPIRRGDTGNTVNYAHTRFNNDRRSNFSNIRPDGYRDENNPRSTVHCPSSDEVPNGSPQAVLAELRDKNNYNPTELNLDIVTTARFFVIKSYSEDDIHRSIKYEIWCSTPQGNKRLDDAFKERQKEGGNILLFFSVNGSMHFCGMAQMMTSVDYNSTSSVWSQDKWKGKFKVKWIYVKDVPNNSLRHICLKNNDNKPVTKSRDTQEVPNAQGIEVLRILHSFNHITSLFDDFIHYEKRQKEEVSSKKPITYDSNNAQTSSGRHYNRQNEERDHRDKDVRCGGSGVQKYNSSSTGSFRDRSSRNNYQASGSYHKNSNYQHSQKERENSNNERDSSDYGCRYVTKFEIHRRDERTLPKLNNRDRGTENIDEHCNKPEFRYRAGVKESLKDNEHTIVERTRGGSDY